MIREFLALGAAGLQEPTRIPSFLRRKVAERRLHRANTDIDRQADRIQELLNADEFLLIIFDACRYDVFAECYEDHYAGDLSKVYSTNTYTKQYLASTWAAQYDLTYVAGGPVIDDRAFDGSDLDYRPSEHFETVVPVWDMGYEKELGVTPPEAVTEAALEQDDARMVVHYFQPHAPYIGEDRIRDGPSGDSTDQDASRTDRDKSLSEIYAMIESGEIDIERVRRAYQSNLSRVMAAAKPLVAAASGPTVITSDHGELFGEDGRYMHGGRPHSALCELPWLDIDGSRGDVPDIDPKRDRPGESATEVEDQLESLGYL